MESSECPKAMMMAEKAIDGQTVPLNQPRPESLNSRLARMGAGGDWAGPWSRSVRGHQMRKITTMTVVICIMRRALPLDSWMPLTLLRQKYRVTMTPKKAEKRLGGILRLEWTIS